MKSTNIKKEHTQDESKTLEKPREKSKKFYEDALIKRKEDLLKKEARSKKIQEGIESDQKKIIWLEKAVEHYKRGVE